MDNSYSSSIETSKTANQSISTCEICFKEFLYPDFVYHMRAHVEQMQQQQQQLQQQQQQQQQQPQTQLLPQRAYPGTYGVPVSSPAVSNHQESFEKMLPPYNHGTPPLHASHGQRVSSQQGPGPEVEKHHYRPEMDRVEAGHVEMKSHATTHSMDNRAPPLSQLDSKLTPGSRTSMVDSHNVQNVPIDGRLQSSVESYHLEQNKSLMGGTQVSYSAQRPLVSDEYIDSRKHILSKVVDSQAFSKPNPYYLQSPHYGLGKPLLDHPQSLYYSPSHVPAQNQMDYYGHAPTPGGDRKMPGFYYGQPPLSNPAVSMSDYPPYNVPASHTSQMSDSRGQLGKPPDQGDLGRSYAPTGHLSPPAVHPDMYKRGLGQTPDYNAVPSHLPPMQQEFSPYKLPAQMAPPVSMDTRPSPVISEHTCRVCRLPCANSLELTEHMRSHSKDRMLPKPVATPIPLTTPVTQVYSRQMQGNTSISMSSTGPSAFHQTHINSQSSTSSASVLSPAESSAFTSTFPDPKQPPALQKPSQESQKFQCRFCKKDFDKQTKCSRHEILHQRDINLFFCEICKEPFKYKGDYLYHMQMHETAANNQQPEHQVIVDCQVCDEEVEKEKLVAHLKTHPVKRCDKCDKVFEQKAEYVEHLMIEHRQELAERTEAKVNMAESESAERSESERDLSDEKDSGLEEDHDKDIEEQSNEDAASERGHAALEVQTHVNNETIVADVKAKKEKKEKKKPVMKNLKDNVIRARQMEEKRSETQAKQFITDNKANKGDADTSVSITGNKKFSCSKCDKSFSKKDELSLHVETHNKDPSRVYCEICDLSYHMKEKGYYMYHMKYHTLAEIEKLPTLPSKLKCQVCSTVILKEKLISHMKESHAKFNCDICKWSYSTESSLLVHMKRIHYNKKYQVVKKADGELSIEEKHMPVVYKKLKDIKAEQQSNQAMPSSMLTCIICSKSFDKKANFDRHMKASHLKADGLNMFCEICNAPFPSRGMYLFHIQKDHSDSSFKIVEEPKVEIKKVLVKRTVLNPETGDFEEKMVEEIVDEYSNDAAESEETTALDSTDGKLSVSSVIVSDIIYCKLCNMSLKKQMVFNHMKTHTVFNCDLCEYTFTKKPAYLTHKRLLHLDDFIADEISSVMDLKKSKEIVETAVDSPNDKQKGGESQKRKRTETAKFLTCLLCEVEFKQDKYVEHIKTHQKHKLSCQFCDRLFSKKSLLVIHERSHNRISHKTDELPYPKSCPVCDNKMNSRSQYVDHLREHTKKKPIKCKKCEVQFTSERNLENHGKVCHDVHAKIIWKMDGEGMRFDLRSGRITEVMSDYLSEIKEINDQLLSNGKSEIWIGATPKKLKEKEGHRKSKEEEIEKVTAKKSKGNKVEIEEEVEEETVEDKADDRSLRRSVRKRSVKKEGRDDEKDDEEEEEEVEEEEEEEDKKKSKNDDDDEYNVEEDEGEDETTQDDEDEDFSPSLKKRRTRSGYGSDESESDEKYTPKGTRTRKVDAKSKGPESSKKQLRSAERTSKRKSVVTRTDVAKKLRESSLINDDDDDESEVTPTREKPYSCPVCKQGFTRERNMEQHVKERHKRYKGKLEKNQLSDQKNQSSDSVELKSPIVGKLRTRATNLKSELGTPASSSTPVKKTKELVVQISPLDMDSLLNKSVDSNDTDSSHKGDKYVCQYCNKSITRKWNFQKHLEYHEKRMNLSNVQNSSVESLVSSALEKSEVSEASITDDDKASRRKSVSKPDKNEKSKQNTSTEEVVRYVCEICNKVILQNKWNYTQHLKTHKKDKVKKKENATKPVPVKKDLKKNGKESKPFPCKNCPEAFKKKRDLYIHAKVHMEGSQEEGAEGGLMDLSGRSDGDVGDSSTVTASQSSDINTTAELSTSQFNESCDKSKVSEETDENKNEKDHQSSVSQNAVNSEEKAASSTNDSDVKRKANAEDLDDETEDAGEGRHKGARGKNKRRKSENVDSDGSVKSNDQNISQEAMKVSPFDPSLCDRGSESPSLPSSHSSTSSEHEEKDRKTRSPHPVMKMTSQSAISKWKAKVQATLASQIELNKTKKQQEKDNPTIAKVKEYLSISGKPERKNYECRLCGVGVHEEAEFRDHMDVHLNQSPPYCGICDRYFMAIYPMRRLAEHNLKKHPELAKKSLPSPN